MKPIELDQAFGGAYRSYRVNGRSKIDVDTFFSRIYIHRKGRRMGPAGPRSCSNPMGREIYLLMVSKEGMWHYTAIKSLSRLLSSKNSNTKHKQHFCMNCLQGFMQESSRDQHQVYCEDNESVRVEMPKQGSTIEFKDGQNQFKVPFIMYADFESILELMGPMEPGSPNPNQSYTNEIKETILYST